jgi:RimJ/RimL family protein N-acetyltransferase
MGAEFNKTTKCWTSRFPGELPETPVVPEPLETDELGIAGVARFIRDEDASGTAEVAIIIADDWQQQGVARLMLDRLKVR